MARKALREAVVDDNCPDRLAASTLLSPVRLVIELVFVGLASYAESLLLGSSFQLKVGKLIPENYARGCRLLAVESSACLERFLFSVC